MRERACLVAVLIALAPLAAKADTRAVAERHLHLGNELSHAGDHRGAIAEYEKAYETMPHPNLLFNLAREHKLLAQTGSSTDAALAIDYYHRYLAERPDAPDRDAVGGHIAALERQLRPPPPAPPPVVTRVDPVPEIVSIAAPPPPPVVAPVPVVPVVLAVPSPSGRPVHRRWWLWSAVAAAVAAAAAGIGIGIAIAVTTPRGVQLPASDLGTVGLHF